MTLELATERHRLAVIVVPECHEVVPPHTHDVPLTRPHPGVHHIRHLVIRGGRELLDVVAQVELKALLESGSTQFSYNR